MVNYGQLGGSEVPFAVWPPEKWLLYLSCLVTFTASGGLVLHLHRRLSLWAAPEEGSPRRRLGNKTAARATSGVGDSQTPSAQLPKQRTFWPFALDLFLLLALWASQRLLFPLNQLGKRTPAASLVSKWGALGGHSRGFPISFSKQWAFQGGWFRFREPRRKVESIPNRYFHSCGFAGCVSPRQGLFRKLILGLARK